MSAVRSVKLGYRMTGMSVSTYSPVIGSWCCTWMVMSEMLGPTAES